MAALFERASRATGRSGWRWSASPDFAEKLASELCVHRDPQLPRDRIHRRGAGRRPARSAGSASWRTFATAVPGTRGSTCWSWRPHNARLKVFERAARDCLDLPVRMIEATALYEDVLGHVPIGTINSAWFQFIMHPRYSPSSPLSKRVARHHRLGADAGGRCAADARSARWRSSSRIAARSSTASGAWARRAASSTCSSSARCAPTRTTSAPPHTEDGDDHACRARCSARPTSTSCRSSRRSCAGQMSLVGPRPEPPTLVEELSGRCPSTSAAALVKPGLTGWAQVRCGYAGSHSGRPGRCATTSTTSSTARRAST